jgi:AcrR family transcriptional regulator
VAVREVANDTGDSFEDLVPELMYIAIRPYLGHEAAREELTLPAPAERSMPDERGRIRRAVVDLVLEHGCEGVDVGMVVARAGLERSAFERHFADLNDCLIDAYLIYTGEFDQRVFGAFKGAEGWREGLRGAAYAAAAYIRKQPREVAFGTVALLAAAPPVQAHRASHRQRMIDLIDAGRQELDDPDALGREVADGVLATINETIVRELGSGAVKAPEAYVPELMSIAVRPYLGEAAAREELALPPPAKGVGASA